MKEKREGGNQNLQTQHLYETQDLSDMLCGGHYNVSPQNRRGKVKIDD